MANIKVQVSEIDGVEFEYPVEMELRGAVKSSGFTSLSKYKILEDQYSYIEEGDLLLTTSMEIDGFLSLEGGMVFL